MTPQAFQASFFLDCAVSCFAHRIRRSSHCLGFVTATLNNTTQCRLANLIRVRSRIFPTRFATASQKVTQTNWAKRSGGVPQAQFVLSFFEVWTTSRWAILMVALDCCVRCQVLMACRFKLSLVMLLVVTCCYLLLLVVHGEKKLCL